MFVNIIMEHSIDATIFTIAFRHRKLIKIQLSSSVQIIADMIHDSR